MVLPNVLYCFSLSFKINVAWRLKSDSVWFNLVLEMLVCKGHNNVLLIEHITPDTREE